ncbi:MAG TPA: phosphoribosylformylglycinamidine synthase subunit PurS [Bryobacteraceae bacterium]|nr:phosphoribosylformylglycinamidine synthase subunit PurS [Bryobacteraceae bacterium]
MTFRVHVSLKATVLDPQGQTIGSALRGQGHLAVADVRQGKFFDIRVAPGVEKKQAQGEIEQIARDVLTNPVIEEFQIESLD